MEFIKLKNSDLVVSRLCMGGCPMGCYGWGYVRENELVDSVHTALDNGVNIFDTADTYGLGQSERILGKALGNKRKDVVIADKFGVRVENGSTFYDNSPKYIKKAVELSLCNLGTDYIDLYQIHYRDGKTPLEDVVDTLDNLKKEGKIRYFGLSNINESDYEEIKPFIGRFVSVQKEYSIACRKNENSLNTLNSEFKLNPFTWGSLGQGILTGKYTKENINFGSDDRRSRAIYVNFHGDKLEQNLRIVDEIKQIAKAHEKPVCAVAIRFILDWLSDSVVLAGVKTPNQILDNVKGCDWKLSEDEINRINMVSKN